VNQCAILKQNMNRRDTSQTEVGFCCNICGRTSTRPATGDRDVPDCGGCGSSIRLRSIVLALSRRLFGADLTLTDFPVLKSLRGMGLSDSELYSRQFEKLFSYTNTFYDREPVYDLLKPHNSEAERYDFVICGDVLEHVAAPLEAAFEALARLIKPEGFVLLSVPFGPIPDTIEHFQDLGESALAKVGGKLVLVARTGDQYRVFDSLTFHLGPGATLERRIFSEADLRLRLASAGLVRVEIVSEPNADLGVVFESPCSLPILASKSPFALPSKAVRELVLQLNEKKHILEMADESRWVRLGRKFGVGPNWKR
jgi:SAM-dependent methyltransferase